MRRPETNRDPVPAAETPGNTNSETPSLILLCQASHEDGLRMIGSQPVAWHVMKTFAASGIRRFVVCINSQTSGLVDHFLNGEIEEAWQVSLVNTGDGMRPAERIAYASRYLDSHDEHCFVAADTAVADIDLTSFYEQHIAKKKPYTVAVVRQPEVTTTARVAATPAVHASRADDSFHPARCIILRSRLLAHSLSHGASQWLDQGPTTAAAGRDEMAVYYHTSFWQSAATKADCQRLSAIWSRGNAPWSVNWPVPSRQSDAATKAA